MDAQCFERSDLYLLSGVWHWVRLWSLCLNSHDREPWGHARWNHRYNLVSIDWERFVSRGAAYISHEPNSAHRFHRFQRFAFQALPLQRYGIFSRASVPSSVIALPPSCGSLTGKGSCRWEEMTLYAFSMKKILPDGDRRFCEALKQCFHRVKGPCRSVLKVCLVRDLDAGIWEKRAGMRARTVRKKIREGGAPC